MKLVVLVLCLVLVNSATNKTKPTQKKPRCQIVFNGFKSVDPLNLPLIVIEDLVSRDIGYLCGGKDDKMSIYLIQTTTNCILTYKRKPNGDYYLYSFEITDGCPVWRM
ncbi:uncharacterized protein LOC119661696 [Hermetia illucens]|uniref:uncharacterized protein LOC119661696 n=1 Tax=Hermetia illucens TaxID=343691 RepID=UPI0018CC45B8|nr:uncharacterized protein LOC119661696 [Hermetia illucens]